MTMVDPPSWKSLRGWLCWVECVLELLKVIPEDPVARLGQQVDTRSKQVDTSPRFQKTQLPDWDSRSTLDQRQVDTSSVQVDTRPSFQQTSFAEMGQQVDTRSGQVDTLRLKVDTRPSFQQTSFAKIGQQVDTRSGQVDTLRLKVKIVNFSVHVAAWELGDLT
ncbi:hypothetical protein Taro_056202 [Colocasia esculenta]|uniref:Uncharacterized protein n=1 Tax=Colocasia esculenta TaxID=4460 RepID=A0A843XT95_COLES|nr:hypothetical protein [Colocasia esculenta]